MPSQFLKKSDSTRQRLITSAIALFNDHDIASVSIADIARSADLTSQAVYRYFSDKHEFMLQALQYDLDEVLHEVEKDIYGNPLPALTGEIWRSLQQSLIRHKFVNKVILTREPQVLETLLNSTLLARVGQLMVDEIVTGQELGITRPDVDIARLAESFRFLLANVLTPLLCENKYNSPEWLAASHFLLASVFYPIPDLTSPEAIVQFEEKCSKIGAEMVTRRQQLPQQT